MSRKFNIIKKKNLPDEPKIVGFSFLKEPTKDEKKKNKFDFIAHSNNNEIGCKKPQRSAPLAYTRGYVSVDNKIDTYVEVKSRLLVFILIIGMIAGLGVLAFTGTGNPAIDDKLPIIGDFDISDTPIVRPTEPTEPGETPTITFSGFGKYTVSKEYPAVELKNPENNFVNMIFTLTDKETGEIIARTGSVQPGKFVYVDVVKFYQEPGTYTILINTATFDGQSGAQMNGMNQTMEVTVQ